MSTKYKVYNRRGSGGYVVEAALSLANAAYDLEELDSEPGTPLPEAFRSTNPKNQVPVLVTPDGNLLTESAAIVIHIAASHGLEPRPGTPDHGTMLRWLVFMTVNIYEAILRRGYASRYTENDDDGVRRAAEKKIDADLAIIEDHIQGPFLLGTAISVADLYLAMLNAWRGKSDDLLPKCDRITHLVAGDPRIKHIWHYNFNHRLDVKWGGSEVGPNGTDF